MSSPNQIIVLLLANFVMENTALENNLSTLRLVHVLFRHGDRTPEAVTAYPNDPHKNESFYPFGLGELTNKGKRRAYRLGQDLRTRYCSFLGPLYTPDILTATSSDVNRTKMSLQLVLAGLFPPMAEEIWNDSLNWQPIPFSTIPVKCDILFSAYRNAKFQKLENEYMKSFQMRKDFDVHRDLCEYVSRHSGKEINNYWGLFFLYMQLKVQGEMGLEIPDWSKEIYPQPLAESSTKLYYALTATTDLRRFMSGSLLKNIVQDSMAKLKNEDSHKNRKIVLYSGHELNVASMLIVLEVFKSHIPEYCACIIFELHVIDGVAGLKIYYQNNSTQLQLLKLPACNEFCPLEKFIELVEEYFPTKDQLPCEICS